MAGFPELRPASDAGMAWSVPWSDLMMVMFILFVVLFITQAAEREADMANRAEADAQSFESASVGFPWPTRRGVRSALSPVPPEPAIAQIPTPEPLAVPVPVLAGATISVESDRSVRVNLPSALLFELGSANIGQEAGTTLDQLARVIADSEGAVRVIGHTDDAPVSNPIFPTNWELSAARAAAVTRELVRRGKLDPSRFTVQGRGMHTPAFPNTSKENQALNRRVEILIAASQPASEES